MAIGTCPVSGEACNFVPVFQAEDTVFPEYTQYCITSAEAEAQDTHFCGRYVALAKRMLIAAQATVEGGNE